MPTPDAVQEPTDSYTALWTMANEVRLYVAQTHLTDLGPFADAVGALPGDLESLTRIVQGLLIFPYFRWEAVYGIRRDPDRVAEMGLRTAVEKLERIIALDSRPLGEAREPGRRLYGRCGDFAMLLTAFLRRHGTPARVRVGFAGYFEGDLHWDHRITEVWDSGQWWRVDPRIDAVQRPFMKPTLDPLDVRDDAPYAVAGAVWRACRSATRDSETFGDSPDDIGLSPIRWALLQDFSALAGWELLGSDSLHPLMEKPIDALEPSEWAFLDEVAALTERAEGRVEEIRRRHAESEYGRAVEARVMACSAAAVPY